jgi:hypothetical protein
MILTTRIVSSIPLYAHKCIPPFSVVSGVSLVTVSSMKSDEPTVSGAAVTFHVPSLSSAPHGSQHLMSSPHRLRQRTDGTPHDSF